LSDVTCACCAPLVSEIRARGLDPEPLVEGLGLTLSDLENPRNRVPWGPFTVFASRAAEMLGGAEQIEEIALRSAADSVPRFLRRLLPHLGSARPVYLVGARWWGPWVFRGTRATCEELADGRLREVIEILPGYAECPLFFQGIRGVLRAMPLLFGQPEAVVDLRHDGRRGEFLITPPPAKRRLRNLFGRRATVSTLPGDLEELGFHQEQLRESMRRNRVAGVLLAEKSRRLETLHRLGRELSQWQEEGEIACAVIRLLAQQFRVRGVRLSGRARQGAGVVALAASGDRSGPPSATHVLAAASGPVGRLELWGFADEGAVPHDEALLRELLPWIGVALENAQSEAAIRGLTQWLEADLADWTRLERRLEGALEGRASLAGEQLRSHEGDSETILLVENDGGLRRVARGLLELEGYTVIEAASRADALAICASQSTPIHLLVTDVLAPSVGREVAGHVIRLHPELRGLMMLRLRSSRESARVLFPTDH
jgi:CheY-like chemotaxis protein